MRFSRSRSAYLNVFFIAVFHLMRGVPDGINRDAESFGSFAQHLVGMIVNITLQGRPIQLALSAPLLLGFKAFSLQPIVHGLARHLVPPRRLGLAPALPNKSHHSLFKAMITRNTPPFLTIMVNI